MSSGGRGFHGCRTRAQARCPLPRQSAAALPLLRALPLALPVLVIDARARREFLLFKGYTLTSVLVLLVSVVGRVFRDWQPELGIKAYLPVVGITLAIELVFVLALLMPIATTIISLHQSLRRERLWVLLVVGLASTTWALARVLHRRDPIVSYATRERVLLRTKSDPLISRAAQLDALRAGWRHWRALPDTVEGDGKVQGEVLDAAHEALEKFYKHDEAFAFDLWASPQRDPQMLVLYFEARRQRAPIWLGLTKGGDEVRDPDKLPRGAFLAMLRRRRTEGLVRKTHGGRASDSRHSTWDAVPRGRLGALHQAREMSNYTLPKLRYEYSALEPHISRRVLELTTIAHHAAYVKNANAALAALDEAARKGDLARLPGSKRRSPSTSRATSCTRFSGKTDTPRGRQAQGRLAKDDRSRLRRLRQVQATAHEAAKPTWARAGPRSSGSPPAGRLSRPRRSTTTSPK